jgi:hypothetical protein
MGSSAIALCPRCRRETVPQLKESSWHKDVHRAAAADMVTEPDPRAERIKDRKARKESLRAKTRVLGFAAVAKEFITSEIVASAPNEDCEECAAIQRKRSARLLGYDPTTHSAYVREIL